MPGTQGPRGHLSRRTFVAGGLAAAVVVGRTGSAGARTPSTAFTAANARPPIVGDPFTMGIASGEPLANRVVIWTRLAPAPTDGGGMPHRNYEVEWEVADDESMSKLVRQGTTRAWPKHGHSVHVDVRGLEPDRWYWYRFRVGDHISPIGRTRTTPDLRAHPKHFVLAHVSCQRYNAGYYTAYDDLVGAAPDLVVHVGDYIYESPGSGVRVDPLPESVSLDQYRNRYGLYKSEPALMAAHHAAPWLFTWDDHEVENNYAGLVPEEESATPDPEAFRARRAAAYKAYWEHMPTRRRPPRDENFRIHRRTSWGRLADINVLDTRQYRSDQCGDIGAGCTPEEDATREMLGGAQEAWLGRKIRNSRADWSVLAQQVVFSRMDFIPGPVDVYNLDQWDGYESARERVLDSMRNDRPDDNVVLTGDIHASGVSDIMTDYREPTSAPMGAEFVGTSISSEGSGALQALLPSLIANNPHIRWGDTTKRGWVKHTVSPDEWRADYRHVDDNEIVGSPVQTATSWVLPRGGSLTQV